MPPTLTVPACGYRPSAEQVALLQPLRRALLERGFERTACLPEPGGASDLVFEPWIRRRFQRGVASDHWPSFFHRRYRERLAQRDPRAARLHDLFTRMRPLPRAEAEQLLGGEALASALDAGLLVTGSDGVSATAALVPFRGLLLLYDPPRLRHAPGYGYLGRATFWLADLLRALTGGQRGGRLLELGTGTGAVALAVADGRDEVVATEIQPSLLELARANAALNRIANAELVLADVYDGISGSFDVIAANLPQGLAIESGGDTGSHDTGGEEMLRRLLEGARERLRPQGRLVLGYSDPLGRRSPLEERLRRQFVGQPVAIEMCDVMQDFSVSRAAGYRRAGIRASVRGWLVARPAERFALTRRRLALPLWHASALRAASLRTVARAR